MGKDLQRNLVRQELCVASALSDARDHEHAVTYPEHIKP